MRGIAIIVATLLVGTVPVYARHGHYHHGVHHKGAKHERITPHNIHKTSVLETTRQPTLAPRNEVDPEALAWAPPQEHFGDRPRKMVGKLVVANAEFPFVSGGHGWSIPWGHWPVTPDEVGQWGSRHGALGLNHGDDIPDPSLHRGRDGMEIHAASRATAGCVGIMERYDELKKLVLGMIERWGHAYLHITPNAVAITPSKYLPPTETLGKVAAATDDDEPRHHHHRHRHT